jgi:hypothetical protein
MDLHTCDKCRGLLVATRTAEARGLQPPEPEALEALELLRLSEGGGGRRGGPRAVTCNHRHIQLSHLNASAVVRIELIFS